MPEIVECMIMSKFINHNCVNKEFISIYNVEKGNIPTLYLNDKFEISSTSSGKEIVLNLSFNDKEIPIYAFMGMSGNWKYVLTKNWYDTKFVRLRMDDTTGHSLILYGGFLGPKYSIGKKFNGVKRGPDPIQEFTKFRDNILSNLDKKDFDKPIYEALLNQKYFSGVGNYIRSTILYYIDENPFQPARDFIKKRPDVIDYCKDISLKSYELNGGQLRDWSNPFDTDSSAFKEWVFYKKGSSIKDSNNRTFWFNNKWNNN